DWKLFFTAAYLERYPDHRLCVTYAMKFPFRGSFRDCGTREKPTGDIGYAPGVVSWQQARDITCGCKGGWIGATWIRADESGAVYYSTDGKVVPERSTTPAQHENYEYRVYAATGKMTLVVLDDQKP